MSQYIVDTCTSIAFDVLLKLIIQRGKIHLFNAWIKKCRGKILTEKIMKLLFQMIKSMNTVCFVCKLQHFLKNTLFQYITASTNINFCTYKFLFCSENWVRRRRKKYTRKKDIYVVIYAKHKIFVDKMFNIFVRHSQYNVSLPYLTKKSVKRCDSSPQS